MNRIDIYINIVCKNQKSASYIFCIRAYITLYFLGVYFLSLLINFKTHEEIDLQFFFVCLKYRIQHRMSCRKPWSWLITMMVSWKFYWHFFFLKPPKNLYTNFLFLQLFFNLYLLILYFRCIFMKRYAKKICFSNYCRARALRRQHFIVILPCNTQAIKREEILGRDT